MERRSCYWVHWTVWPGQWGRLQSGPEQSLQEASCCHGFRFLPNVQFTIAEGLSVSRKGLKLSLWWEGERGFRKICAGGFPAGDIHNGKWCHVVENAEKFFKQQKNRALAENQKEIGGVKRCLCIYVHACLQCISGLLVSRRVVRGKYTFTQSVTVAAVWNGQKWMNCVLPLLTSSFSLLYCRLLQQKCGSVKKLTLNKARCT